MKTGRKAVRHFVFWLFLGAAAGVFLAAVLSYHEYQTMEKIVGSVIKTGSLAKGLKERSAAGSGFLNDYGYRPMGSFGDYIPFTAGISELLFLTAGLLVFWGQYREEIRIKSRVLGLTEYLRAVNRGEGAALRRSEDEFSHLEDEMYKTVMELWSTREAAVKNHEVLTERIADIAHQLKTPLTSMSLMTELLEEYQTNETKEYYSRLSHQIERLKNLVAGLLALAKLDAHGIVFHKERIELSELMESVSELLGDMMEERRISLVEEECPAGCVLYGDRQWTEEALLNILKNCVEHTPDGGRILVAYRQNPIYTELKMEDEGCGFAKKDLPHIFERFYRGEGAAKDNAGIGLALAKAVLDRQNGYLYAENTADGHGRFRVKWYTLNDVEEQVNLE